MVVNISACSNSWQFIFSCRFKSSLLKYIETKVQITCFYLFRKQKETIWNYSPCSFSAWFLKKSHTGRCLTLYPINWRNFIVWLSLLLEMLGNMCIVIVCFPDCDIITFESNVSFHIKSFSHMAKKVSTKN